MFIIIVPLFNPDIHLWLITEMKELSPIYAAILALSWSLSASTHLTLATCSEDTNLDCRTTLSPPHVPTCTSFKC